MTFLAHLFLFFYGKFFQSAIFVNFLCPKWSMIFRRLLECFFLCDHFHRGRMKTIFLRIGLCLGGPQSNCQIRAPWLFFARLNFYH